MLLNRAECSDVLGVSLITVDNYVRAGMPFVSRPGKKGKTWQFDSVRIIKWLLERDKPDGSKAKKGAIDLRLAEAEATLKEIQVAEKQGSLIHIDDVADQVNEKLSIVKSRLSAIPGRLAQFVAAESDPAECLRMLKAEVSEALEAISDYAEVKLAENDEKEAENAQKLTENDDFSAQNDEESTENPGDSGDFGLEIDPDAAHTEPPDTWPEY